MYRSKLILLALFTLVAVAGYGLLSVRHQSRSLEQQVKTLPKQQTVALDFVFPVSAKETGDDGVGRGMKMGELQLKRRVGNRAVETKAQSPEMRATAADMLKG
jgi:hypothetical protein